MAMNEERIRAIQEGLVTYNGKECKKCGGHEKYVVSGGCAPCQRKRALENYQPVDQSNRMPTERACAKIAGMKMYHGKPCRKCGGTERYTAVALCVACSKENSRRRYHALAELAKAVRNVKMKKRVEDATV